MKSKTLLNELNEITQQNLTAAEHFNMLSIAQLNKKVTAESWSILECLEHLNLYGDFYHPEITNQIKKKKTMATENFKPGLLGNYFAKSMLPKEKLNKMKTLKDKNPLNSDLSKSTVTRFIKQQEELLLLLAMVRETNLNQIRTAISITKLIKLKLGDTLRVVVYHNKRHIVQAQKLIH